MAAAPSVTSPRRARRASAPRSRATAPPEPWWLRVRWDRVGRTGLLVVLVGLMALYAGPLHSYLTTWRQSRAEHATVASLERDHARLAAQHRTLLDPRSVAPRARALGMIRPGERSYVVTGLPGR